MSENAYQPFTDPEVWKKAGLFKNDIKELTKSFPGEEKFRLADQIIRSSRSINATIAEGHGNIPPKINCIFALLQEVC